jgi:hypothetical protein
MPTKHMKKSQGINIGVFFFFTEMWPGAGQPPSGLHGKVGPATILDGKVQYCLWNL